MPIRKRLGIAVILVLPALAAYILGRQYAPDVITFVVEHTLVEKSPPGTDSELVKSRFRNMIAGCATTETRMRTLLQLSQYMEKVQELSIPELESLLRGAPPGAARPVL